MGTIIKIIIILYILGLIIAIFEKVTGINLTGDEETKEKTKSEIEPPQIYSPLEKELKEIEPGAYERIKKITEYIVTLYNKPCVEMENWKSSIDVRTILSKYLDNQLSFSEKYNGHVIVLAGRVKTVGKDEKSTYICIVDNSEDYANVSINRVITCHLDHSVMEDENCKNIILNIRPGIKVILTGVLKEPRDVGFLKGAGEVNCYGFSLRLSMLIEADGVVPQLVMDLAEDLIREKYQVEEN